MATTATYQRIEFLASGLEDSNGDPLSGYQVRTYEPDGSTARNVYEEQAGTTAKSSFSLDTTGRAIVYGDGIYIIKIWTSTADPDVDSPYKTYDEAFYGTGSYGPSNTGNIANVYGGYLSLSNLTIGTGNSAFGKNSSLNVTSGNWNCSFGINSLGYNSVGVTGTYNFAVGNLSLSSITSGSDNNAIGRQAGYQITTGDDNVLLGTSSGAVSAAAMDGTVAVGTQAGNLGQASYSVYIGYQAGKTYAGSNAVMFIGNGDDGGTYANTWLYGDNSHNVTIPLGNFTVSIGGITVTAGNLTLTAGDLIITTTTTPASAGATGTAGTIAWDADYIYVCVATDTWKRVGIATW